MLKLIFPLKEVQLEKARHKERLVPEKRQVSRGGKTYSMTVWVNPQQKRGPGQFGLFDEPEQTTPKKDSFLEEREKRSKQAEEYTHLVELGQKVIPGIRLQDAETAGKLWKQKEAGELSEKEWQHYVIDLKQSNKISIPKEEPKPAIPVGKLKEKDIMGQSEKHSLTHDEISTILRDKSKANQKTAYRATVAEIKKRDPGLYEQAENMIDAMKTHSRNYGGGHFYTWATIYEDDGKPHSLGDPWPASRFPKDVALYTTAVMIAKGEIGKKGAGGGKAMTFPVGINNQIADIPTVITSGKLGFDVPEGWIIMNASRPLYGNKEEQGNFRHGTYYALIDPNHPDAGRMIKENKELDGWMVHNESETELYNRAKNYMVDNYSDIVSKEEIDALSKEEVIESFITDMHKKPYKEFL